MFKKLIYFLLKDYLFMLSKIAFAYDKFYFNLLIFHILVTEKVEVTLCYYKTYFM